MRYRHILWDFDGTLFDTYPPMARAFAEALRACSLEADWREVMGWMKLSMETAKAHYRETLALPDAFFAHYKALRVQEEARDAHPFAGAPALLRALAADGARHYLVTHRSRETAHALLARSDLLPLFADGVTSEDGFARKPDPAGVNHLLSKHGIAPREAIMVGDRDLDVQAGQRAGITTCFFDPDSAARHRLADYTLHALCDWARVCEEAPTQHNELGENDHA